MGMYFSAMTLEWTLPNKWIAGIALLAFLIPVIGTEWEVLSFTHGIWSYPFDDTFIHLAIAKNIAYYGVWGISPHTFSSASSSVLYPLLLAGCMKIFGLATWLPFAINLLAGIALIIVVQRWLARQGLSTITQILTLLALILLTPLPALVIFGMEHTLQLLFDFLFIYQFAAARDKTKMSWTVYLFGFLVMATRYEGMFLIALAGLLLLTAPGLPLMRRIRNAAQLGAIASLPIVIFGLYAMSKGSYFIPNSVLVKSTTPGPADISDRLFYFHPTIGGIAIQRLLILLPLTYLFFLEQLRKAPVYRCILLMLMGVTLFHLLFASTSILFRYESYLIGCSIPVVSVMAAKYGANWLQQQTPSKWLAIATILILALPLFMRSQAAFSIMARGSINIYEQQYQMGQFVHRYYNNTPMAMGDIGAISFFSQGRNLDLEGLGNLEVARSRKNNYWTPDFLDQQCRKDSVKVAIIFDRSYPFDLRRHWYKVATWQIPGNLVCYSDVVSFYAVDSANGPSLEANLKTFQPSLPGDVVVQYR